MEIKLAREMGFCFGVRRAVGIVEKTAAGDGPVTVLGSLVHNPQVEASLKELGVITTETLDEVQTGVIVIPSHGAPPRIFEKARAKKLTVIDATCPFVRVAQKAAEDLAKADFRVIVLGDRAHSEVRGIVGWAGGKATVVASKKDLDGLELHGSVGVLSQTTQTMEKLRDLGEAILEMSLPDLKELRIVNTICSATAARQTAALELAVESDMVLVIGGRTSANTRRLMEICKNSETEAYQVEEASEVQQDWIIGRERIGITAGASTPDYVVKQVVRKIRELGR